MVNIVNEKAKLLSNLKEELEKEIDCSISKQLEYNAKGESVFKEYVEVKVDREYQQVEKEVMKKYEIYGYEVTNILQTTENLICGCEIVPITINWYKIDWSNMP